MIKIPKLSSSDHTTYHNHRAEPYFTFMQQGKKTIEGRIKKGYYRLIKPCDHIIIYNEDETKNLEVLVKRVTTYKSFKELLENEILGKVLPDAKTIDQGISIYKIFYSKEQEKKFGVVAIEVEKANN